MNNTSGSCHTPKQAVRCCLSAFLRQHRTPTKIVVGISGGADSVALLHILHSDGNDVAAVHVNHNLRGAESDGDEAFVRALCERLGVPLRVVSVNVRRLAEQYKLGVEEAARKLRYEALETARRELNAEKIAVGHTADDNAETVIMNLCRGAGLKGLCGIPPENGRIIRPLLKKSRAEIEEYLLLHGLEYIHDTSNFSNEFLRNRIRNIIMPALEKEVGANVKAIIAKNTELLRDDEDFLSAAAFAASGELGKLGALPLLSECFVDVLRSTQNINLVGISPRSLDTECEANTQQAQEQEQEQAQEQTQGQEQEQAQPKITLDIQKLNLLHPAIKKRVIRIALEKIRTEELYDISAAHILAVLGLAKAQSGREIHLPSAIVAKEYDKLIFTALPHQVGYCRAGACPSRGMHATAGQAGSACGIIQENHLDNALLPACPSPTKNLANAPIPVPNLSAKHINHLLKENFSPRGYCTKAFDCDKIHGEVFLRTRLCGDKITLRSGSGQLFTQKLQDFFTNKKVPKSERDNIPLLAYGSDILWFFWDKEYANANYT
ncbi:MAG: tRNA lysidine(34) synthetase TilS [Defluviitaleaceae bacterium]|nr:tRNA lysidine(34) synthetase TilS [Defluviitaleaceae bacterium]